MKKQTRRSERVADLVRAEISRLILLESRDPLLRMITVTDVVMPADLRSARIYFSTLGGDAERDQARASLDRAAGFLRREVGRRCALRFAPELHFFPDRSLEQGARIEELLAEHASPSAETDPAREASDDDGGEDGPDAGVVSEASENPEDSEDSEDSEDGS
jgi:ribosome-binding factor A